MRRLLIATAMLMLAACTQEATTGGGPTPQATTAPPQQASRCETAPDVVVNAMTEGLKVGGGGSLRGAQAVKSKDFSSVYFVSADLQGSGLDGKDDIATWSTNRLDGSGLIFSVDAVAKEFSQWGDGGKTDAQLDMSDDGAEESQDCTRKAI